MPLPAYILAGGKSSRFGSDKARAPIDGTPMICHIASTLGLEQVTVIADRADKYADLALATVADMNPGLGPMAGLQTALHDALKREHDRLLLVSCDLRGIQRSWVDDLLQASDKPADIIAYRAQYWEPLCAIYHTRLLDEVDRRIDERDLSMQRLLDSARTHCLSRPLQWSQANTPEELSLIMYKVLVFGPVAKVVGDSTLSIAVKSTPVTCADLRQAMARQYPATVALSRSCRFAVNHAFAAETHVVTPSDEIALIGLVCGG